MKNRPERKICFLVVWLTMISCISVHGQDLYKMGIKKDFSYLIYPGAIFEEINTSGGWKGTRLSEGGWLFRRQSDGAIQRFGGSKLGSDEIPTFPDTYSIPSNLYYIQSGIMCKAEWQLEKATHIPFRFRLGSLADCNAMEGKH